MKYYFGKRFIDNHRHNPPPPPKEDTIQKFMKQYQPEKQKDNFLVENINRFVLIFFAVLIAFAIITTSITPKNNTPTAILINQNEKNTSITIPPQNNNIIIQLQKILNDENIILHIQKHASPSN